jgi:hypothetical protein
VRGSASKRVRQGGSSRTTKEVKEKGRPLLPYESPCVLHPLSLTLSLSLSPHGSLRIVAPDLRIRRNSILAVPYTPDIRWLTLACNERARSSAASTIFTVKCQALRIALGGERKRDRGGGGDNTSSMSVRQIS